MALAVNTMTLVAPPRNPNDACSSCVATTFRALPVFVSPPSNGALMMLFLIVVLSNDASNPNTMDAVVENVTSATLQNTTNWIQVMSKTPNKSNANKPSSG